MRIHARSLTWMILLGGNVIALMVLGHFGFHSLALDELAAESENHLTLFVSSLRGRLERFEYLPEVLARDHRLVAALHTPRGTTIREANHFLESVAATTDASDVYLMDAGGNTVAASNWNLDHSFVGRNFSFRPYFQQAMAGGQGRYFALGTTSHQRGFYYAYPITFDREIRGAVVVKVNLAGIERNWAAKGKEVMVTDDDGVIFLTSRAEWLYATIDDLSATALARVRDSLRYADAELHKLRLTPLKQIDEHTRQVLIGYADSRPHESFLIRSQSMPLAGWTVHMVSDTRTIREPVIERTALAGFGVLIVVLLVILYRVNRQRQRALEFARDRLENRVEQRTLALRAEVEERRRAETELRDTQAELIHAAKMAGLGQMSAGISHELNQPLTAIRSYADNARRMLERGSYEPLAGNLAQIHELTERMAGIIDKLRGFSRKSRGERKLLSLREAVDQALGLFRREIERQGVAVHTDIDEDCVVQTDPLLLDQVLVNLLSNALHAVDGADRREIAIATACDGGGARICVTDSGAGIASDVIANIFDPFFTTKEVGLGLGLGLSISYRIMERLGGAIHADNLPGGGARFTITLPVPSPRTGQGETGDGQQSRANHGS